jgi:hypothetical protein
MLGDLLRDCRVCGRMELYPPRLCQIQNRLDFCIGPIFILYHPDDLPSKIWTGSSGLRVSICRVSELHHKNKLKVDYASKDGKIVTLFGPLLGCESFVKVQSVLYNYFQVL